METQAEAVADAETEDAWRPTRRNKSLAEFSSSLPCRRIRAAGTARLRQSTSAFWWRIILLFDIWLCTATLQLYRINNVIIQKQRYLLLFNTTVKIQ